MKGWKKTHSVFKRIAHPLIVSLLFIVTFMIVASILIYDAENEIQPDVFNNALSGVWWAFVGYSGVYPVTIIGKVLAVFLSIFRICFISVPIGIICAGFVVETPKEMTAEEKNKHVCPDCEQNIDES